MKRSNLALTVLAVLGAILLLKQAQEVFIPLVVSALLFQALDPLVDRLDRIRIPRVFGAAIVLLTVVGAGSWTAYSVRDEALAVVESLPAAARNLRESLQRAKGAPEGTIDKLQRAANEIDQSTAQAIPAGAARPGVMRVQIEEPPVRATDVLWWGSLGIVSVISQGIMVLFLTYFLLLANDLFKRKLVQNFGNTLAKRKITIQILDQISTQIGRFLLVQVATSALVAIVTGAVLWWLGVQQAVFWGIAAGVLNSIPYFGPLIVTVALGTVAFSQFGTASMALAVSGSALLITTLEGWLLTPSLMGRAAQMNQVAIFVGLIFWSWIWGVWGILLAVPMMMLLKSVCDHIDDLKPIGDFLGD